MELQRKIMAYCERMSEAFWAEPLNAITNIAFLVGATAAFLYARRADRLDGPVLFLCINAFVVGIGSFLFHTFATRWAAIADTTPIMIFILAYFTIAMNRYAGLTWGRSALAMLGFLVAMIAVSWVLNILLRDIIGGSVSYGPALLALLAIGAWLASRGHGAGVPLMLGAALFTVSLSFRAADQPFCSAWSYGTHFGWHLLNGLLLWWLIMTLIRHGRPPEPASRTAPA